MFLYGRLLKYMLLEKKILCDYIFKEKQSFNILRMEETYFKEVLILYLYVWYTGKAYTRGNYVNFPDIEFSGKSHSEKSHVIANNYFWFIILSPELKDIILNCQSKFNSQI